MRSEYITKADKEKIGNRMGHEDWLIYRVMLETGLRVGDAVSLKRGNIVRRGEDWYIRKKAEKTGKVGEWKISPSLGKELHTRKGWLFPGRNPNQHITRQAVWKRLKVACEKAGVDAEGKSPHSMRKVFAVEKAHEEGFRAAQQALQHEKDGVTRLYVYADKMLGAGADEPVRWRDIDVLIDHIIARLKEKNPVP